MYTFSIFLSISVHLNYFLFCLIVQQCSKHMRMCRSGRSVATVVRISPAQSRSISHLTIYACNGAQGVASEEGAGRLDCNSFCLRVCSGCMCTFFSRLFPSTCARVGETEVWAGGEIADVCHVLSSGRPGLECGSARPGL